MDPYTLRKDFTCRICGRFPGTDIVMAEDGFVYHRECMSAHSEKTKNFISPKTIKCLIEKLSDDGTSDLGASQINDEKSGGESSCNDAADLIVGDLLARRGYNTYFGCNNTTKNQSLGIELLVKAANEGSAFASYKIGSMYSAGVHGFKVDTKKAKRYLTLAKELSTRSGSLAPSELENIESYLDKL